VRYSLGQKWKTGTGRQDFTDTGLSFNECDIIGLKFYQIRWKKTQNKGY